MSTFIHGTSQDMLASVAVAVDAEQDKGLDVHTISLILNGQHGEFDLVIESTDADLDDHRAEYIAHRNGSVTNPDGTRL